MEVRGGHLFRSLFISEVSLPFCLTARQNNWPPLPSFCPVQPCFFQDISMEIPQEFQKTVSTMYYLWMCES